jgi:uncharacterized protein YyaL (SSP411 family)
MLYDNALLSRFAAHLWQATHDEEVKRVATETVQWLAREMTSPEGGFYSSLDADSEGHEGKFYVWTAQELDELLGEDSKIVRAYYNVTPAGNFEGLNILHRPVPASAVAARLEISEADVLQAVERARPILYAARSKRVWPGRDDKTLAAWNGLMLRGVAECARVFQSADFRQLALRNAEFLFREMVRGGRVMRSHKDGVTSIPGFLEDHAAVALGFIAVYELTFDEVWIDRARAIASETIRWFWDDSAGAFFDTASDAEKLITRPRDVTDNAMPSGTSLAAELLLKLAELLQDADMRRRAVFVLETLSSAMGRYPSAFGHALGVADMSINGAVEVALVGDSRSDAFRSLESVLAGKYVPSLVLAGGNIGASHIALMQGRTAIDGLATAYVCQGYVCEQPVNSADEFARQLDKAPQTAPS